MKKLSEHLAPGLVELVYLWVATIFKAAVGDRLIAASPCIRIALAKKLDTEVIGLSVSDVDAFASAIPIRYKALIVRPAWVCARANASG